LKDVIIASDEVFGLNGGDRQWWQQTHRLHADELAARMKTYLMSARRGANGCLELGTTDRPERLYWRGRRLRVYQLIAWGQARSVPLPKQVVRHLCNNRACINPKHLRIGTQAENLYDQLVAKAKAPDWSHP
jgi:hypothetical protein